MKSQLTKDIEAALSRYSPASLDGFELNYRRGQYLEFEVPCTHSHIEDGLVDAVWLAEGFNNHHTASYCSAVKRVRLVEHLTREVSCSLTEDELRTIPVDASYPCLYSGKCFWKRDFTNKEESVAIICFEIKISKADFHRPNGHNFVGNLNYYVMPFELFKSVESEIPAHIGVITYHCNDSATGRLVKRKSCLYHPEVNHALYNSMLLTVLNKREKQTNRFVKASFQVIDEMSYKLDKVASKLLKSIQAAYPTPECLDGTSACYSARYDDKCSSCPYSSTYKRALYDNIDGRVMLNEYCSSILRR